VLEIPAGESLSLKWSGRIYEASQSCSCGMSCYSSTLLSPGTVTFRVPFTDDLDTGTNHQQIICSVLPLENAGSIVQWRGPGLGLSDFSSSRTFTVSYTSGQSISLVF
jgi:hypothetical protein